MEVSVQNALAAWLFFAASTASMASPTEVVRVAVDQVLRVLEDADLARPVAAEQRRQEIRRIAELFFDFPEMARRALARHWSGRTSPEREEFVRLFRELLERSYFGKIENYSHERIAYTGETVDGEFATVRSKIVTGRKAEIPIDYRLHVIGSRWAVYDVLIEGVSFVSTYRAQFDRIIQTSSYEGLIEKMRLKALELTTVDRNARKP
jgi:phospholipid transport system substrate-binding protein